MTSLPTTIRRAVTIAAACGALAALTVPHAHAAGSGSVDLSDAVTAHPFSVTCDGTTVRTRLDVRFSDTVIHPARAGEQATITGERLADSSVGCDVETDNVTVVDTFTATGVPDAAWIGSYNPMNSTVGVHNHNRPYDEQTATALRVTARTAGTDFNRSAGQNGLRYQIAFDWAPGMTLRHEARATWAFYPQGRFSATAVDSHQIG